MCRYQQHKLDDEIDYLQEQRDSGVNVEDELNKTIQLSKKVKDEVRKLNNLYNSKFNPLWGQLFKADHQDSRFAKQVMDYACLYTSRASNLAFSNPNRFYRPIQDFMPHDIHDDVRLPSGDNDDT